MGISDGASAQHQRSRPEACEQRGCITGRPRGKARARWSPAAASLRRRLSAAGRFVTSVMKHLRGDASACCRFIEECCCRMDITVEVLQPAQLTGFTSESASLARERERRSVLYLSLLSLSPSLPRDLDKTQGVCFMCVLCVFYVWLIRPGRWGLSTQLAFSIHKAQGVCFF
jgi:hypothetical protein